MPKVYSYVRFSSKAQATGDSLRRQTAQTLAWATRHGHVLDESLSFRDLGVSAYDRSNLRTGALGLFLKAAQQGKIEPGSILAIEALDRLTRAEPLDAFRLLSDIVSCKISIVTVSDERVYDESSLNGDFASLMLAAALLVRGHEESKRKSQRLKEHYSARRASGSARISHTPPNWIKAQGDGWCLIAEHAKTVLNIFEMSAQGIGANTIAQKFNEQKRPVINSHSKGDSDWHASRISTLLRNRAVIGEYQPHSKGADGQREKAGEAIANHYPAAVPEELYWRVQALVTQRGHRKSGHRRDEGYANIFSGILSCGYCESRMYLDKKGSKNDDGAGVPHMYYGCSRSERHASECDNRVNYVSLLLGAQAREKGRFPRPLRFGLLPALFEHLLMRGDQLSATAEQAQEAARLRHDALSGQLASVDKRKAILFDSLESGMLTLAEVQPRLDRIRAETTELQSQLQVALTEMTPPEHHESSWIDDAVLSHMDTVVPVIKDMSKSDERAALRTRLMQRLETIYLYRECARVVLRHDEVPLFIALQENADLANAQVAYPLPMVAA
jgi:DNA invertase Pin-like site-specific DNA recombinase